MRKKILLVDDSKTILSSLGNFLTQADYEVFSTTNGREAIEIAKNRHPHIIILDVFMPDMGGEEVGASLSRDPSTNKIPVIYLTGMLSKEEEASLRDSGRHYMAKPIDGTELIEKIEEILSG